MIIDNVTRKRVFRSKDGERTTTFIEMNSTEHGDRTPELKVLMSREMGSGAGFRWVCEIVEAGRAADQITSLLNSDQWGEVDLDTAPSGKIPDPLKPLPRSDEPRKFEPGTVDPELYERAKAEGRVGEIEDDDGDQ